jgi:hypothetical protein
MKRRVPRMTTDEEAEAFLESNLSDLDFTQFKPARFRFASGGRAAESGRYELTGPRGNSVGEAVSLARGEALPPAPKGCTWRLVEPARNDSDT